MACGNCGTGANGKAPGCKSNGGCSSGGCNRMNVFDWLADLPLSDSSKPYPIIEVTFNKGARKEFYRNNTPNIFEKGQWIVVEGSAGFDVGQVSLQGELVKLQMKKYNVTDSPDIKKILRPATDEDVDLYHETKTREQELLVRSRVMSRALKLDMKIAEVELQADGRKGTFYYTADQRVDFRELIRQYATDFKMKVEMKQIGARQESGKVGGIGSCGRELCCSTWLTDFKSVNTAAARYQNLSINQTKLSGQCGRLKCCLNYELDTYMDGLKAFPSDAEHLETAQGRATLQKRDIFKNLMWYSFPGSSKQYPVPSARVKEVVAMNKAGEKPEELGAVDVESIRKPKADVEADRGFVNDVGQISLRALERNAKSRRHKSAAKAGGSDGRPAQPGTQQRPKQQEGQRSRQGGNTQKPAQQSGGQQRQQGQGGQRPRPQGAAGSGAQQDNAGEAKAGGQQRQGRNRNRPRGDGNKGGGAGNEGQQQQ